ncbi:hypothetical protein FLBR109950_05840 [Flavobacterium branchiophilum]
MLMPINCIRAKSSLLVINIFNRIISKKKALLLRSAFFIFDNYYSLSRPNLSKCLLMLLKVALALL